MSLEISYSIFADKAVVEAGSRKISLIGIFNVVHRSELIVLLPTVVFYAIGHGSKGEHELTLKVVSIDEDKEQTLVEMSAKVNIPNDGDAFSQILNMVGLPLLGKELRFMVYTNNKLIHDNSIKILARGKTNANIS